ncbi:MAG: PEP-CTERM sorting domain-containing protein [Pirellulales bacterium]
MRRLRWFDNLKAFALVAALVAAPRAFAATFVDTVGDNFDGNTNMDIASVDVTDDGSNITFKITLAGSIASPSDWGKYVIGIDKSAATGDFGSPVGNPWGRNIAMADGTDAWIGSWADSGGGFQPWTYAGGSWTQNGSGVPVLSGNMTTITTSLASLGLAPGQSFKFDVYTTGSNGGDSANDSAANLAQSTTGWGGPYTTPAGAGLSYATVPEPATLGLMGLAAVAMLGASRRRT